MDAGQAPKLTDEYIAAVRKSIGDRTRLLRERMQGLLDATGGGPYVGGLAAIIETPEGPSDASVIFMPAAKVADSPADALMLGACSLLFHAEALMAVQKAMGVTSDQATTLVAAKAREVCDQGIAGGVLYASDLLGG